VLVAIQQRALGPRLGMRQKRYPTSPVVSEKLLLPLRNMEREATTNAASRAADTLSNTATSAAHAMQETGTKWGNTVQQSIGELFERQPLLLGVVGIAIGAGIAASIPTTEAENKVMGGASDFVREAVSEKAAQVKEMADAAVHEAKAQGLTPEAAGEALRAIGDKVGALAQVAASKSTS